MDIDLSRLKSDLEDYYGSAMFSGLPMAVVELSQVENASPQQLVELSRRASPRSRRLRRVNGARV